MYLTEQQKNILSLLTAPESGITEDHNGNYWLRSGAHLKYIPEQEVREMELAGFIQVSDMLLRQIGTVVYGITSAGLRTMGTSAPSQAEYGVD